MTTWGTAIVGIKNKIDKIERSKKTSRKRANDALAFHGEAAKEFSYLLLPQWAMPIFLLTVFAKNEKTDLSRSEKNELSKLISILVQSYRNQGRARWPRKQKESERQ